MQNLFTFLVYHIWQAEQIKFRYDPKTITKRADFATCLFKLISGLFLLIEWKLYNNQDKLRATISAKSMTPLRTLWILYGRPTFTESIS